MKKSKKDTSSAKREIRSLERLKEVSPARRSAALEMAKAPCYVLFTPTPEGRTNVRYDGFASNDALFMWLQERIFQSWDNPVFRELLNGARLAEEDARLKALEEDALLKTLDEGGDEGGDEALDEDSDEALNEDLDEALDVPASSDVSEVEQENVVEKVESVDEKVKRMKKELALLEAGKAEG